MSEQRFFTHDDPTWLLELCPERDSPRHHCPHRGMQTYTSNPTQHDETCCFCGETVRIQDPPPIGALYVRRPGDHGPHLPTVTVMNAGNELKVMGT